MKKITLTQGQFALVDDEDFERVNQFEWHASFNKSTNSFYARRSIYVGPYRNITHAMQRFLLDINHGDPRIVDHINHNTLDNQRKNLRICDPKGNARNASKRKDNSVGLKGVSLYRRKFMTRIRINGKSHYIGSFKTAEEAHEAYKKASKKYHGEFGSTK